MIKLTAYYNHGRWLVKCPKCNSTLMAQEHQTTIICLACHPRIRAMGYVNHMDKHGVIIMRQVPDRDMREEAVKAALKAGEEYGIEYPEDWAAIERVMRLRPVDKRNWIPTETLEDVKAENLAHGLEVK